MARTSFPEFASLNNRWIGVEYLYAFQISDGVVKVGRSCKPRSRLSQFARELARSGKRIVQFASLPTQRNAYYTEAELIARVTRIGLLAAGKEWFYGVSWGQALTLLRQIAPRQVIVIG